MRARARRRLLLGILLLAAPPVSAQDTADSPPLPPEDSALLANALVFDPEALATPPKKSLRIPGYGDAGYTIERTEKADGSASVVVKQPLHTEWSNSLGLTSTRADPLRFPLPTEQNNGLPAGAAWASVGVPNLASVDARIDPTNEQGKVGATLKHSVPFGNRFAVTVQDSYSVTDTFGQRPPGPADLPLMALPASDPAGTSQVFGNERSVKFNILPTGTTFGAGLATVSNDPVTHNTFSAEQKLYGPLHVTTAVTDVGQATSNKSITAGFKLNW
ncbi:MAG TPA: hypothetical protein VFB29_06220 [Pseudolabrys sp.]|nr:hypothetical protein [Pseudolabrys sp.]